METIKLHDKVFRRTIPYEEIVGRIGLLAGAFNRQWRDSSQPPVFVSVLNGAFMFTAELMKRLEFTCELAFVKVMSYTGTESSGKVTQVIGLDGHAISGRDVVVLEDIVETGNTIEAVRGMLLGQTPRSIAFASLFYKPEAYVNPFPVDHYAMELPNDFIVGFGLDYNRLGRNLPDVYTLITE